MITDFEKMKLEDFESSSAIKHHNRHGESLFLVKHAELGLGVYSTNEQALIVPCSPENVTIEPIETLAADRKTLWLIKRDRWNESLYCSPEPGMRDGVLLRRIKAGWRLERALTSTVFLFIFSNDKGKSPDYRFILIGAQKASQRPLGDWRGIQLKSVAVRKNGKGFVAEFQTIVEGHYLGSSVSLINHETLEIESYRFGYED